MARLLATIRTRLLRLLRRRGVLAADGADDVVCTLAHPWHDGTRHLIFTPHEFLERLATITPRLHINLVLYHGVLAPRDPCRA